MGQAADLLTQHIAVALDVRGADLQQVVEPAGDHVTLLHLGYGAHGGVEGGQGGLAGVGELHLGEGDVVQPQLDRVDHGAEAANIAELDQPLHPHLGRGLRQTDLQGQVGHRHPAVRAQGLDDQMVEPVDLTVRGGRKRWFGQFSLQE